MTESLLKVEEKAVNEANPVDIIVDGIKTLQDHALAINETIKLFIEDVSSKEAFNKEIQKHDEESLIKLFGQIVALNSLDKAFDSDKEIIRDMLKAYDVITHSNQAKVEANDDNQS